AGAEQNLPDLVGLDRVVGDHALETPFRQVGEGAHGFRSIDTEGGPEQALRREDDERFAPLSPDLSPQDVEELRRGGRVADLDVVLGGLLEKAFHPGARVLRALPLVAVGKVEDQAAQAQPLVLARGDELVDDDLTGVEEIAELRLPDDERLRRVVAEAELE